MNVRVARILTRLNLGGPARQVLASDPLLATRGFEVRVYTGEPEPGEGDLSGELARRGVEVVRVAGLGRAIRPIRDLVSTRALRRELAAVAPDHLPTHASKAGFVGRRAVFGGPLVGGARLAARTAHTFHGHVLEGYFPPTTSKLMARLEAWLARDTDVLVAVSEATADDLARLGVAARERFKISPPGVELAPFLALAPPDPDGHTSAEGDGFRAELGVPRDAPLALVLGRLAPIKRPEMALAVFARAAVEAQTAHLVLVGDGAIRPYLERQRDRMSPDVRDRIHFAGARKDVVPALAAADVLLATSRNEGLPVAMIEAGAAARPVVSTAVGGVPELVRNGVTGLLAIEEEGLALALASLLTDPAERRRMGLAARAAVETKFSARALADRLEALYRTLLDRA
ncbi:MAG: glycosyltransferase family 4 protein [Planctomycetota bacterium]